jgi:uncharacterized membrane protein YqjE
MASFSGRRNMRQEIPKITETLVERESFGDLLSRLATASAGLVRDEIELAKQEFREKAKSLRIAMIIIAIAALLGTIALFTLDAALVIGIGKWIGYGWSALLVGIAIIIVSGIMAAIGVHQIKRQSSNLRRQSESEGGVSAAL